MRCKYNIQQQFNSGGINKCRNHIQLLLWQTQILPLQYSSYTKSTVDLGLPRIIPTEFLSTLWNSESFTLD